MKSSLLKNISLAVLLVALIGVPVMAFAIDVHFARPGYDRISLNSINTILGTFLTWMWTLFSFMSIVTFTWIGFLFINAKGEASKLADARKMLIWGVVGVIVGLLAISMISIVSGFITPAPAACIPSGAACIDSSTCCSGSCILGSGGSPVCL